MKLTRQQLEARLWGGANILRGNRAASAGTRRDRSGGRRDQAGTGALEAKQWLCRHQPERAPNNRMPRMTLHVALDARR